MKTEWINAQTSDVISSLFEIIFFAQEYDERDKHSGEQEEENGEEVSDGQALLYPVVFDHTCKEKNVVVVNGGGVAVVVAALAVLFLLLLF